MREKIVIVSPYWEHKFNKRLINFINEKFDSYKIHHVLVGRVGDGGSAYGQLKNTFINDGSNAFTRLCSIIPKVRNADVVILNGLFYPIWLIVILITMSYRKELVWIGWGGDIYIEKKLLAREWAYRLIIQQFVDVIALPVPQDIEKLKGRFKNYKGKIGGFWFPTQLVDAECSSFHCANQRSVKRIMIGHSADPSNHHLRIIDALAKINGQYLGERVEYVFVLAYGSKEYAGKVLDYARHQLGNNNVIAITEMIAPNDYYKFLNSIDIGIFDQERQQAGHNIVMLASLGAKIFINRKNTFFGFLHDQGIVVYDTALVHAGNDPLSADYPFPDAVSIRSAKYVLSDEYAFLRIQEFLVQMQVNES